jgi:CRISPR/Cas system-associated endonuclease Cas3-HD
MARELALATSPGDENFARLASISGLLHDLGKYSDAFQQMLLTGKGRPQHAIHGGLLAKFGTANASLKPGLQTVAAAASTFLAPKSGISNTGPSRQLEFVAHIVF